jgi:hypothetical protein
MINTIKEINERIEMILSLSSNSHISYMMSIVEYSEDMLIEANKLGYIDWSVYLKTFRVDPLIFEDILVFNPQMVDIYKLSKDFITTAKNPWLIRENWSDSLTLMARLIKGEEK